LNSDAALSRKRAMISQLTAAVLARRSTRTLKTARGRKVFLLRQKTMASASGALIPSVLSVLSSGSKLLR
jgi:hypothetical protein